MRKNFSFMFKMFFCIVCALQSSLAVAITVSDIPLNQATLISSNDDYGLELDWVENYGSESTNFDEFIYDIATDENNNTYVAVDFYGGPMIVDKENKYKKGMLIIKYDQNKNILWYNCINNLCENFSISCSTNGDVFIYYKTKDNNIVYDNKVIYEDNGETYKRECGYPKHTVLLALDDKTGDLKHQLVTKKGMNNINDFYKVSNILQFDKDGNFYLILDMVEDFVGLNTDYPSECRSTGKYDKYIAKFTPDFKIVWDFALNETSDFDKYAKINAEYILLKGDTLFAFIHYCTDIQINPDKTNPVYIKYTGGSQGTSDELTDGAAIRYDISGNTPKLIDYRSYNQFDGQYLTNDKFGNYYISTRFNRETYNYSMRINQDLSMDTIYTLLDSKNGIRGSGINSVYGNVFFDKNGSKILCMEPYVEQTIRVNDTLFIDLPKNCICTNVYDSNNKYKYTLVVNPLNDPDPSVRMSSDITRIYTSLRSGFIYYRIYNGRCNVNLNLDPNEKITVNAGHESTFIRYVETYRIREESSNVGSIKQAGEMVRFGSNIAIEVEPNEGYKADSVFTDKGEKLDQQADGTFLLRNVTDATTLKVYYSQKNGVEDYTSSVVALYPNPATEYVTFSGAKAFDYKIVDVKGQLFKKGRTEDGIVSISDIPSGSYILQINKDKVVRFEKK